MSKIFQFITCCMILFPVFLMAACLPDNAKKGSVKSQGKVIVQPRTDAPMDEYTKYYKRKVMDVNNGQAIKSYTYYWFEPERPYPEGLEFPLVLLLHGGSGKAYAGKYMIAGDNPSRYPAFIMVPVTEGNTIWAYPEKGIPEYERVGPVQDKRHHSLHDIVLMVREAIKRYPVDQSRIYVLGCSEGGYGAFAAAFYYPDLFAAAVPISGGWSYNDAPQMLKVPLWIHHGTLDDIAPVELSRDMHSALDYLGAKAYFTEYDNMAHACPSSRLYRDDIWKWLFNQKK